MGYVLPSADAYPYGNAVSVTPPTSWSSRMRAYRGNSLIRHSPPLWDHHRVLGIVLLQGPRRRQFLLSEVPLY